MSSLFNRLAAAGLALLVLLVVAPRPAAAYFTGACIKKSVPNANVVQYHMRVPHAATRYAYPVEDFPGQVFYDVLKKCRVKQFTTTYDINGNAHVDFQIPARKFKNLVDNKCDVANQIGRATLRRWTPACVEGTPASLAKLWRDSWVGHSRLAWVPYNLNDYDKGKIGVDDAADKVKTDADVAAGAGEEGGAPPALTGLTADEW